MHHLKCLIHFVYTYHTGMVVSRVRMNHKDANAYAQCFRAIFEQTGEDHPSFKVGESLIGIIADWSDQQVNGLEMVIGKSTAESILKGCQVRMVQCTGCGYHFKYRYISFDLFNGLLRS